MYTQAWRTLVIILGVDRLLIMLQTKLPSLRDQSSAGSEMKLLTYYRGYDNVLLGQGYRTTRGAVIDEYGAMVGW
jgi:hypothetical protein